MTPIDGLVYISICIEYEERAQVGGAHEDDGDGLMDHHGRSGKYKTTVSGGKIPPAAQ